MRTVSFASLAVLVLAFVAAVAPAWSQAVRGWIGVVIGLSLVTAFQGFLTIALSRKDQGTKFPFFRLITNGDNQCFNLSKFQFYIWTVWIVIAFVQSTFRNMEPMPPVPLSIAWLMGIVGFAVVFSSAISDRTSAKPGSSRGFVRDIFAGFRTGPDVSRAQMFLWTIIVLVSHIAAFWRGDGHIPAVDTGLLIIMAMSNGIFLGMRTAESRAGAGSVSVAPGEIRKLLSVPAGVPVRTRAGEVGPGGSVAKNGSM